MSEKPWRAEELAERWGVETAQVYRQAREGKIPAFKVGRYYRFRRDMIEAYERGDWKPLDGDAQAA